MSRTAYKIVVNSGPQKGTEFLLTKRITRLGASPGCDIAIPGDGIPDHLASIDIGGSEVLVFNRAEIPLSLAAQNLSVGSSGAWKDGKLLLLPNQVQLRLESYVFEEVSKTSPTWQHEADVLDAQVEADDSSGAAAKGKASKNAAASSGKSNAGPIAFIAACVIVVILLVAKKLASDPNKAVASGRGILAWSQIWEELNSERRLNDHRFDSIRDDLGRLYRLQSTHDALEAPKWKSQVMQELMSSKMKEPTEDKFPTELREFVIQLR